MERKNVKIQNLNASKVKLNFTKLNGRTVLINGNGTVKISEDELMYLINSSNVIKKGSIKIVNENELSNDIDKDDLVSPNSLSDDGIIELLKKSQASIKKEIAEVDSIETIERILNKAHELDKSVKLIAILEERLEELRQII